MSFVHPTAPLPRWRVTLTVSGKSKECNSGRLLLRRKTLREAVEPMLPCLRRRRRRGSPCDIRSAHRQRSAGSPFLQPQQVCRRAGVEDTYGLDFALHRQKPQRKVRNQRNNGINDGRRRKFRASLRQIPAVVDEFTNATGRCRNGRGHVVLLFLLVTTDAFAFRQPC